ncbi:MAG: peptidase M64 N-terminal domain-containing protein [Alistipes finegoldii]
MKKIFIMLFLGTGVAAAAQTPFADCFFDKTMRFDYYHAGDSRSEEYFFDALKEEPYWAGSKVSLVDTTGYGNQFFRIVDRASGREIYSRGFCTLFNEWQSTPEADSVRRSYPESVVFPIPNVRAGSRFSPATAKGVSRSVSARISTPIPILSSGSRPAARRSR